MTGLSVPTPHGLAEVEWYDGRHRSPALLLGHGAGGSTSAPDLVAVSRAAQAGGVAVALVTQPYRVTGRRAPAPARQLDEAWLTVAGFLADGVLAGRKLIFGGRSSGARVACRTAAAGGAVAVLCLAFPVHPPGRPDRSRMSELERVDAPVLVVQGECDPFGHPEPAPSREVVLLAGDHSLKADPAGLERVVGKWLQRLVSPSAEALDACYPRLQACPHPPTE